EAPEAEAPEAEAPEAEAPEAGEGPEAPSPRPLQGKPSGTARASAAPGPAPTGSPRPGPRGQEAEPDDPALHDLIAAHRLGEPAPVEARSAAREAGFEEMALEKKPPSLVRRFFTVWRHAVGLVYGAAIAVARDRDQFAWVKGVPLLLIKTAA